MLVIQNYSFSLLRKCKNDFVCDEFDLMLGAS
jgi:hypothetical protein